MHYQATALAALFAMKIFFPAPAGACEPTEKVVERLQAAASLIEDAALAAEMASDSAGSVEYSSWDEVLYYSEEAAKEAQYSMDYANKALIILRDVINNNCN